MAVYDLEEQEQLDELKAWWKQYGRLVFGGDFRGGGDGRRYLRLAQLSRHAGTGRGRTVCAVAGRRRRRRSKKVQDITAAMIEKYPRTGYASFAALAAAKVAFDSGDAAAAKSRLQWVVDNGRDDETRDIARLRLAAVLLDDKKFDDALKSLDAPHVDTSDRALRRPQGRCAGDAGQAGRGAQQLSACARQERRQEPLSRIDPDQARRAGRSKMTRSRQVALAVAVALSVAACSVAARRLHRSLVRQRPGAQARRSGGVQAERHRQTDVAAAAPAMAKSSYSRRRRAASAIYAAGAAGQITRLDDGQRQAARAYRQQNPVVRRRRQRRAHGAGRDPPRRSARVRSRAASCCGKPSSPARC